MDTSRHKNVTTDSRRCLSITRELILLEFLIIAIGKSPTWLIENRREMPHLPDDNDVSLLVDFTGGWSHRLDTSINFHGSSDSWGASPMQRCFPARVEDEIIWLVFYSAACDMFLRQRFTVEPSSRSRSHSHHYTRVQLVEAHECERNWMHE